jgi:hypothetical protein
MQYTITQDGERRFEKTNSQYKQKKIPTWPDRAIKWSGYIRLEMESMLVEINTEIINMENQDDEFHNETEYK